MTFEEFQATRVEIDDVRRADRHGVEDERPDDPIDRGWEYATGLYLVRVGDHWPAACRAEGPVYLIIGNEERIGTLEEMERALYDAHADELSTEDTA